jgi:predicted TIM-barrel fold metal-dependent hydrolase
MKPANRLSLNYRQLAKDFTKLDYPIIDAHSHIRGNQAVKIYDEAARHHGIGLTYSMTPLNEIDLIRAHLGEKIEFIAIPDFSSKDRRHSVGRGYAELIPQFKSHGAKIVKFWNAPRIYDSEDVPFVSSPFRLNAPERIACMKVAIDLGMIFMVHIGDPNTWFSAKYKDVNRYGTKDQQYEDLEEVVSKFQSPWIAAHMGGYPEDLNFLSGLLERNKNLYLDCSATKWIVRELSKHTPEATREFFTRWKGRILFGSDIVTGDAHLTVSENSSEMESKASNPNDAYDLYASRYWALRTLLETDYVGPSPIADPDLHLVNPQKFTPLDAPTLRGCKLSPEVLRALYHDTARTLLNRQN